MPLSPCSSLGTPAAFSSSSFGVDSGLSSDSLLLVRMGTLPGDRRFDDDCRADDLLVLLGFDLCLWWLSLLLGALPPSNPSPRNC